MGKTQGAGRGPSNATSPESSRRGRKIFTEHVLWARPLPHVILMLTLTVWLYKRTKAQRKEGCPLGPHTHS